MGKEDSEELVQFVKNNCGTGKCVVTGLALGGLYASYIASQLDLTGIVFGAPSTEELPGNVQNYIGENDPVGEFSEKVVFIKQETTAENVNKPYSPILIFDENGKAVVGEQSEYSKFCSWFYHTAGPVHSEVWQLFFKNTGTEDDLIDPNLYSLFMKIKELSKEGIKNSLQNIVNYLNKELAKKNVF